MAGLIRSMFRVFGIYNFGQGINLTFVEFWMYNFGQHLNFWKNYHQRNVTYSLKSLEKFATRNNPTVNIVYPIGLNTIVVMILNNRPVSAHDVQWTLVIVNA